MKIPLLGLVCASAICFTLSTPAYDVKYTIIDLGTFLSTTGALGHDINDSGHITGIYYNPITRAYYYDGNMVQDIGTLGGQTVSIAMNSNGQITGDSSTSPDGYGDPHAFLYDGGTMLDLGTLDGVRSYGRGINDSGQVVGHYYFDSGIYRAFIYDGNTIRDIGTLGGATSSGQDINNSGQVTGTSLTTSDEYRAYIYDGNTMQALGSLGGNTSSGVAINDSGQVTGQSSLPQGPFPEAPGIHAYLYDGDTMQDLGTLGGIDSGPADINNKGAIVGWSYTSSGQEAVFLYENGVMMDLCVMSDCTSHGWDYLFQVGGINNSGDIVGTGSINGEWHVFLAQVVSPVIDIEKRTNGKQADGPNDSDVPRIVQGEIVTWTYEVTNPGEVAFSEAEVSVTDSQPGVMPVLDTNSDDGGDMILSPSESWTYTATAQALDLTTPPEGVTVVPGCYDGRNTYKNIGRVDITGAGVFDEDTSHYCNEIILPADTPVASVLPSSRSVQVGNVATAFATMINPGSTIATDCGITPLTSVQANYAYQTTDANNELIGTVDTPVDIAAGGNQSYVFAFTPTASFSPVDVQLSFDCTNTDPAAVTVGLNTLLLVADSGPVPDIVALGATPTGDGIVNLSSTGVFAVATVNVGSPGTITVSADTGSASLPLSITLCGTNPATGACINPTVPTLGPVTTSIAGNATPTFAFFVTGTDTVPFDPANNRIFVRFKDASGVTRGSTSVAVRTLE